MAAVLVEACDAGSSCRQLMQASIPDAAISHAGVHPPPPLQELLRDTLGAQSQVAQWVQLVRGEGSGGAAAAAAH